MAAICRKSYKEQKKNAAWLNGGIPGRYGIADRGACRNDSRLDANSPLAIDPGLVRLSVGIENVDDLMFDLNQALG